MASGDKAKKVATSNAIKAAGKILEALGKLESDFLNPEKPRGNIELWLTSLEEKMREIMEIRFSPVGDVPSTPEQAEDNTLAMQGALHFFESEYLVPARKCVEIIREISFGRDPDRDGIAVLMVSLRRIESPYPTVNYANRENILEHGKKDVGGLEELGGTSYVVVEKCQEISRMVAAFSNEIERAQAHGSSIKTEDAFATARDERGQNKGRASPN